ncbi:MAG: type II secretion system protein GspK [Desulfobacteraceae bacterium]
MTCSALKKYVGNQKGTALLVTLALVSVLAAAALEIGRQVNFAALAAMQEKNRFMAQQMALSGIHLAMFILDRDANDSSTQIDSVQEDWADPDFISRAVDQLGFDQGTLELEISDELGKIQINALIDEFPGSLFNEDQRALLERFFNLLISADKSLDERDAVEIINCIKDWLDSGDNDAITGISGAESAYYQGLDPPVVCANDSFDCVNTLFMVKGISKDILKSKVMDFLDETEISSEVSGELSREKSGAANFYQPELSDFFTVYGMDDLPGPQGGYWFPGRVNINTAKPQILAALLPVGMEDQAEEMAGFRRHKTEDNGEFTNTLEKGWYEQVLDLSEKEKKAFERIIRYSSRFFTARSTALVDKTRVSFRAVIKREKHSDTQKMICRLITLSGK